MANLLLITFVYVPLTVVLVDLSLYAMAFLPLPRLVRQYIEFGARSLAYLISLIVCAFYGIVSGIIVRYLGDPGSASWPCAKSFKWVMRYSCNVRFDIIEGEEYLSAGPSVIISNHQTELDVLMLGAIWPKKCSVTAKSTLKSFPFLGQFMTVTGAVFIDRVNRSNALAAFEGAAKVMKEKQQKVFIFPEGTRSYSREPTLLAFKKGAFHLAVKAQVPIVPVVVANYSDVLYLQGRWFRSGRIPVKVLPPISAEGMEAAEVDELTRTTRELMLKELVKLSSKTSTVLPRTTLAAASPATNADSQPLLRKDI